MGFDFKVYLLDRINRIILFFLSFLKKLRKPNPTMSELDISLNRTHFRTDLFRCQIKIYVLSISILFYAEGDWGFQAFIWKA